MKSKLVLSVEQMKYLRELGLNTSDASMCYCCFYGNIEEEWELEIDEDVINQKRDSTFLDIVPTYTFQEIIELLPKEIKTVTDTYYLTISTYDCDVWSIYYSMSDEFDYYKEFKSDSLIDAAYEMLCWCIENGYIKINQL